MAIDLASIKNELFPGLAAVEGRYKKIETKWSRLFEKRYLEDGPGAPYPDGIPAAGARKGRGPEHLLR